VEELHHNEPNCRVFIATTKCDLVDDAGEVFPGSNRNTQRVSRPSSSTPTLRRAVSEREVNEYAATKNARVFLTSAKSGLGVEELFQCIASDMGDTICESENDLPSIPPTVRLDGALDQGNATSRGRCC